MAITASISWAGGRSETPEFAIRMVQAFSAAVSATMTNAVAADYDRPPPDPVAGPEDQAVDPEVVAMICATPF